MRLKGKTIIITGAASGIGRAVAIACAKEGAKLTLVDITEPGLMETKAMITTINNQAEVCFVLSDVCQESEVIKFVKVTVEKYGAVDGILNNAGITGQAALLADYDVDQFSKVLDVNLKGVFMGMKYALKEMIKQKSGSIINMSSIGGLIALETSCAYVATKHAVIGLCKNGASEYGALGIRFNAICPGFTNTELIKMQAAKQFPDNPQEFYSEKVSNLPAGRFAEPEEVADLVVFLFSDESKYINGTYIPIDGGYVVR